MSSNRGQNRFFLGEKDSPEFNAAKAELQSQVDKANAEFSAKDSTSTFRYAIKTVNFKSGKVGLYWLQTWNKVA